MRRTTTLGLALAGALAAASGAYALGTQVGGGAAVAKGTVTYGPAAGTGYGPGPGRPGDRHGGRWGERREAAVAALASRLGVTEAKLRQALQELRPQRRAGREDHRAELTEELATALGVPEADVTKALDGLRADRGTRRPGLRGDRGAGLAAALARALNVDQAKVTAALQELRADHEAAEEAERAAFVKQLAAKLGISEDEVKSALAAGGPFGRHGGRGHGPRP